MLGECLKELEESHDQHAVLGKHKAPYTPYLRNNVSRFFNSHCDLFSKSCSRQWRPSFWCMLQSARANRPCETLERANCPTSKTSRLRSPPPRSHPPPRRRSTRSSPESRPPCTSPPTCLQTPKSFSVSLVSSARTSRRYQSELIPNVLLRGGKQELTGQLFLESVIFISFYIFVQRGFWLFFFLFLTRIVLSSAVNRVAEETGFVRIQKKKEKNLFKCSLC